MRSFSVSGIARVVREGTAAAWAALIFGCAVACGSSTATNLLSAGSASGDGTWSSGNGGPPGAESGSLARAPASGDGEGDVEGSVRRSGASETASGASGTAEAPDASEGTGASESLDGGDVVDTDLAGKMLFGYQGWFACPGDGSQLNEWEHWLQGGSGFQVDFWPDLSEFTSAELFKLPGITLNDGTAATVFSAYPAATVARHFQWMKQYGLDGALLQRFLGEVQTPSFFAFRNQVTKNVMEGAQAEGRLFAIEYDLSGVAANMALSEIEKDWMALVDTVGVLESPRYLQYKGKPALFVWGVGFPDRPVTPAVASQMIAWLQTGAPARYRAAVVGGVPSNWRTLNGDSDTDPAWAPVYRSLDVVSPWTVGRFANAAGADQYRTQVLAADMATLGPLGVGYLPVVFPGFSWHNLNGGPLNQIPRGGGSFYWRQVYNAMSAGATMMKTAMFDEMNEGTAMLKMQPTVSGVPAQGSFVTLDIDGQTLQSDHYLSVGGAATRMLHGGTPLTSTMPTLP
jgi:hypothetical protein